MRSSKEIAAIVKSLREKKGLSLEELSKRVGAAKSTLSRYENGQREFPVNDVGLYADALDTTVEHLLGIHMVAEQAVPHRATSDLVPRYGSIAAGLPLEMIEVQEYVEIPMQVGSKYPNAFLLTVNGESMNKVLPSGAYALIDPTEENVKNGDVVAVKVNGSEATLKRFYKLNNTIVLEPDSYDHSHRPQTFDCTKEECEQVKVIGRLVWFMAPPEMKF